MSKMIQLRNVPDALHRQLKARATGEGMSLSDYLIREARAMVARPTLAEFKARLAALPPVLSVPESSAEAVRAERENRDASWS
ncbi:MAG: hypothetical protein SFV21_20500 [Rhodospirillaceae bacterium]|nr:hypothetical protein [Rhodospirillaceae bacterium]